MSDLSNAQREFLALADSVDRVKGLSNIRTMFGGRDKMEEGIDDLEERGLIERKAHGVWKITEKGKEQTISQVSCRNCKREFASVSKARESATLFCGHEVLDYSLREFND
jgi:hypothetical protein